jgi:hypothetical protein
VKGSLAAAVVAVLVLVLVGCGGSHEEPSPERTLTIPAYGPFPKQTYHVAPGTKAACRREAAAFGRAAEGFLLPFPSDADNYRVLAQVQFTAFKAHLCNTALLREELSRRLTDEQVREVLSFFGFLRETARELLPGPQR